MYRIAGIDVHKKKLAVVVTDVDLKGPTGGPNFRYPPCSHCPLLVGACGASVLVLNLAQHRLNFLFQPAG